MTDTQTTTDVVCAACGCVCDDLRVTTEAGRIARIEPACPRAEAWFEHASQPVSSQAWLQDQPVAFETALAAAAELLRTSKSPLVLGRAGCAEGQRSAIALAERLGGTLDTGSGSAATIAFQQVGKSTCTLGELQQRADVIVCWNVDPVVSHPRFLERYVADASSLIVLSTETTATAKLADLHLRPQPDEDYELIAALRGILADIAPPELVGGISRESLIDLAARLRGCRAGGILFGSQLTRGPVAHATIAALYSLVRELNASVRFYVHELRNEGGGNAAVAWQTGYSGSVNFARGYPRSNPGETSADAVLSRGEADCCVLLDEAATAGLSAAARAQLAKIPVIRLENGPFASDTTPAVRIAAATYGVHAAGTAYRLDDVPLPLRQVIPSSLPNTAEILDRILAAL